jgi:hypothetical protein
MFWITDTDLFQKETMNSTRGYFKLVQNPTRKELLNGIYKPRLTLTKRFNYSKRFEPTLSIELSLPKLVYGNNFDELEDKDFPEAVKRLMQVLTTMGIKVFTKTLETAPISLIHYSKNIPLTDGSTPHYLISKIKEANISLALDVDQTDYRNDGHCYKWHANTYEIAFYDKIHDLDKARTSDKRAIENDNAIQLNLFDTFQKRERPEVLRMEVRLNQRQKMGKLFRDLGINTELIFRNLFSSTISQKILLHYLDEMESNRPRLLDLKESNSKALLADFVINNPKLGLSKTFQVFGLKQALDKNTPRELRTMFGNCSQRSWYRLMAETKKFNLPATRSPFGVIREHLTRFEPLKLVDFQDKMINNDKYN